MATASRIRSITAVAAVHAGLLLSQVGVAGAATTPGTTPGSVPTTPGSMPTTPGTTIAPAPGARQAGRYADAVFGEVDITTDVVYGTAGGDRGPEDLKLDLYQPRGDTLAARPVVVYVHGGFFAAGNKREGQLVANELARRGYVVASVDYRLYAGGLLDGARLARAIPAAQHDAQAAVRWLRANATTHRLDPDAIAAMGYSAGGITAVNVAFHADDPGDSGNPGPSSTVAAAVALSGSGGGSRAGDPPLLMFHGAEDRTVPYASGVGTCAGAVAAGNWCKLVAYPGVGHMIYERYADWLPQVVAFFGDTLVPALDGLAPNLGAAPNGPVLAAPGPAPLRAPAPVPAIPVRVTPTFTG